MEQLLLNLAEELKTPLMQIARRHELMQITGSTDDGSIGYIAESALQLIDSYSLGIKLNTEPGPIDTESISVSSVLYDCCQQLTPAAKLYGVGLEMDIAGRFGPVNANRRALQAALASLGSAMIEAMPAWPGAPSQLKLKLGLHRSRYGIVAGFYSDNKQLSGQALQSGRKLAGFSRQPAVNFSHTSGAGVFVAESILRSMNLKLGVSRHHNLYGIGAVLSPSHQLELV